MIDLSNYLIKGDKWIFDLLSNERKDIFPSDYKLEFLYTSDLYDNEIAVGKSILKLQEYLALIDIPNFFVVIHTNNLNIEKELSQAKRLFAPFESDINVQYIDGVFDKQLSTKDSLCYYPWIHLYVNPQGLVGTCCEFNEDFPLGNINNSTLTDIVNNSSMREVRQQMLSNQRPSICSACWKREDNGIVSARQVVNQRWAKYASLIDATNQDGSISDFKLRYLDFRASNICNLKCRMCSGKFSSRIAQEESDIYNYNKFIELKLSANEINNTLHFVEENIQDIDAVYFAGGEPLLMSEHYQILDLLIKHNRTDVKLSYNTNLTVLKYKNINIIDYWKQFIHVSLGASIDLIGNQANYVRGGTDYNVLEQHFHQVKDYVDFNITSIVHILNIFNLPKLQHHWISNHHLPASAMSFRILIHPENMSLQVLPREYKQQAEQIILEHIKWLNNISGASHLVSTWNDVLQYMQADDQSHLLNDFFRLNDDKDRYRNETFEEVFPEYTNLRSYV